MLVVGQDDGRIDATPADVPGGGRIEMVPCRGGDLRRDDIPVAHWVIRLSNGLVRGKWARRNSI